MSYEKVKIMGVREITQKKTGQIHKFLQVQVLMSHDIYLNDDAIKLLPAYEDVQGQEVLLPVEWGEYNGKPSLNLSGDFAPLSLPTAQAGTAKTLSSSSTHTKPNSPI